LTQNPKIETVQISLRPTFSPQILLCLALAILTLAVYWPVRGYDFVNYDDPGYITENKMVQRGLTGETAGWAFQTSEMSNWHPLTWLSYLLDWQIYGNNAGGFHLTNVLFHAANAILLFLLLQQMIGARWGSFVVAALFAVHPLHIESVAWISERKDVLSGFFALLTMIAYVRYVRADKKSSYFLALFFFALGLMSKPMLVTLPFVLLLLDFWPLHRMFGSHDASISNKRIGAKLLTLFVEKLPFFVLTILASVATFVAQAKGGAVSSLEIVSVGLRISNAFIACVLYLKKMIWPTGLAIFYPYHTPKVLPTLAAAILVIGISAVALVTLRRKPILAVGWFWFLGMLVPVLGIVQVGAQSLADRYTYLPMIGISIVAVWGISELTRSWPFRNNFLAALSAITIAVCFLLSRKQLPSWKNSETLWRHAIAVTSDNDLAYYNLGGFFVAQKNYDEAIPLFQEALKIYPRYAEPHEVLGQIFATKGKIDEALSHYKLAIKYKPNSAPYHKNLGDLLDRTGKLEEAAAEYSKALEIQPGLFEVRYNLAVILFALEKTDAAIQQYSEVVQLKPAMWQAHVSLGLLEMQKGNRASAKAHFNTALQINPNYAEAHFFLGNILAQDGDVESARQQYSVALKLKPDYAEAAQKLKALSNKSD
jgi:tetratricopeptide (TPR) repeat protein